MRTPSPSTNEGQPATHHKSLITSKSTVLHGPYGQKSHQELTQNREDFFSTYRDGGQLNPEIYALFKQITVKWWKEYTKIDRLINRLRITLRTCRSASLVKSSYLKGREFERALRTECSICVEPSLGPEDLCILTPQVFHPAHDIGLVGDHLPSSHTAPIRQCVI